MINDLKNQRKIKKWLQMLKLVTLLLSRNGRQHNSYVSQKQVGFSLELLHVLLMKNTAETKFFKAFLKFKSKV